MEPLLVYVRFGKWDEILAAPQPDRVAHDRDGAVALRARLRVRRQG